MSPRPPNLEFQQWWNRERERVLLSPETPSDSSSAASGDLRPSVAAGRSKSRWRRQLLRHLVFILLRAASFLLSLPRRSFSLLLVAVRRAAAAPSDRPDHRLYRLIRAFLCLAVVLLIFEVGAYLKGWHFEPPSYAASAEAMEFAYARWLAVRAAYLAPPVQAMANVCIVLFLVQSVDRIALVLGCFWIRIRGLRPVAAVGDEGEDLEGGKAEGEEEYPMVLLQIPMCNEREVSGCGCLRFVKFRV